MQHTIRKMGLWAVGLLVISVAFTSCKKEGCTDPNSINYDVDATVDDGTCEYPAAEYSTAQMSFNYVWGMAQEPWTVGNT